MSDPLTAGNDACGYRILKMTLSRDEADSLSDLLVEREGILSASIEDFDAGKDAENPVYVVSRMDSLLLWNRSVLTLTLAPEANESSLLETIREHLSENRLPEYSLSPLKEKNWVLEGRRYGVPLRIGKRLWIVPSGHRAPGLTGTVVFMDPGLAFGSGTHATTRLCLEWIEQHVTGGISLCDFGCGSGILAIAAAALGAGRCVAMDSDPQALESTRRNALKNRVSIEIGSPDASFARPFDVIVANILVHPLAELAPAFFKRLRPGGYAVLSGILADQESEIKQAYSRFFECVSTTERESWLRMVWQRNR
jgi:ribosomal protein L11 methyltransferase